MEFSGPLFQVRFEVVLRDSTDISLLVTRFFSEVKDFKFLISSTSLCVGSGFFVLAFTFFWYVILNDSLVVHKLWVKQKNEDSASTYFHVAFILFLILFLLVF